MLWPVVLLLTCLLHDTSIPFLDLLLPTQCLGEDGEHLACFVCSLRRQPRLDPMIILTSRINVMLVLHCLLASKEPLPVSDAKVYTAIRYYRHSYDLSDMTLLLKPQPFIHSSSQAVTILSKLMLSCFTPASFPFLPTALPTDRQYTIALPFRVAIAALPFVRYRRRLLESGDAFTRRARVRAAAL